LAAAKGARAIAARGVRLGSDTGGRADSTVVQVIGRVDLTAIGHVVVAVGVAGLTSGVGAVANPSNAAHRRVGQSAGVPALTTVAGVGVEVHWRSAARALSTGATVAVADGAAAAAVVHVGVGVDAVAPAANLFGCAGSSADPTMGRAGENVDADRPALAVEESRRADASAASAGVLRVLTGDAATPTVGQVLGQVDAGVWRARTTGKGAVWGVATLTTVLAAPIRATDLPRAARCGAVMATASPVDAGLVRHTGFPTSSAVTGVGEVVFGVDAELCS